MRRVSREYTPRVTPIRKARRTRYLSTRAAAEAVGVSPETWRRIEQGTQRPSHPGRIAEYLGIPLEDVMDGRR